MAKCTICNSRPAKRYCLARGEEICAQCCATEREVSINCPYACDYLRESRRHEKLTLDPRKMPHPDVQIDEAFVQKSEMVLMLMAAFLNKALQPVPNATDHDAGAVIDSLVAEYRAAVAGQALVTAPEGEIAAGIAERFRDKMDVFIAQLKDREGGAFADRVFLGVAVFMARVAYGHDNGRPRCRAYIHYLRSTFPDGSSETETEAEIVA